MSSSAARSGADPGGAPQGATRSARRGLLLVVSAPSGTGKTTIVERLVQRVPDLAMSRSYTSRPARHGEADGVDYNFVSRPRFEEMVAADEFREDLMYRINTFEIHLPPLRERIDDVPELAKFLLARHSRGARDAEASADEER